MKKFAEIISALLSVFGIFFLLGGGYVIYTVEGDIVYKIGIFLGALFMAALSQAVGMILEKVYK